MFGKLHYTQDVLHLLDLLPRWFVLVLQRAAEARSGPNLKGKSTPFQKLLKFDHFLLHFLKDRTTRLFLYYFANSISLYVPSVQPLLPGCRPELLRGLWVGLKCVFFLVLFPIYFLQKTFLPNLPLPPPAGPRPRARASLPSWRAAGKSR